MVQIKTKEISCIEKRKEAVQPLIGDRISDGINDRPFLRTNLKMELSIRVSFTMKG